MFSSLRKIAKSAFACNTGSWKQWNSMSSTRYHSWKHLSSRLGTERCFWHWMLIENIGYWIWQRKTWVSLLYYSSAFLSVHSSDLFPRIEEGNSHVFASTRHITNQSQMPVFPSLSRLYCHVLTNLRSLQQSRLTSYAIIARSRRDPEPERMLILSESNQLCSLCHSLLSLRQFKTKNSWYRWTRTTG